MSILTLTALALTFAVALILMSGRELGQRRRSPIMHRDRLVDARRQQAMSNRSKAGDC